MLHLAKQFHNNLFLTCPDADIETDRQTDRQTHTKICKHDVLDGGR